MKRAIQALGVCLVLPIIGCSQAGQQASTSQYQIQLYVSLGSGTTFPSGAPTSLTTYWGKNVYFSVQGIDSTNSSINLNATVPLNWTGSNTATGTQYAAKTFTLTNSSGTYPGGSYTFKIWIDMNGDGSLDSGDIVMDSYSIIADTDNNPSTPGVAVSPSQYGSYVTYNGAPDYSITVDDPLALAGGFPWKIDAIHEGTLAVAP